MIRKVVFSLLIFTIFFSCAKQHQQHKSGSIFSRIKTLEYSQYPDAQKWETLYRSLDSDAMKKVFILSAGQTRIDSLFPLLKKIFLETKNDSLLSLTIFSLAQTDPTKSEHFFIDLLANSQLSATIKIKIIQALGYCGSQKSLPVLYSFLKQKPFRKAAFYSLAKLARKKIFDENATSFLFDSLRTSPSLAEAYYIYYLPLTFDQINKIIHWLPRANPSAKIQLLKKLAKLSQTKNSSLLFGDSSDVDLLKSVVVKALQPEEQNWRILLPALVLSARFPDSLMFNTVKNILNFPIPAVRIQAAKSLAAIDANLALPLLTSRLSILKYSAEKAYLIRIIASINPSIAYLLINKNLDKGSSFFRKILLTALGDTKFPLAIRMLHQFLEVQDPVLIDGAFSTLDGMNALKVNEVSKLLQSDQYPVVATAIDWFNRNGQSPSKETLFRLFKKFNKPGFVELQLELAQLFKKNYILTDAEKDSLKKNIAHPYIRSKLVKILGIPDNAEPVNLSLLPDFLQPDSLVFSSKNPVVEIKTDKGTFLVELYPGIAPLTVKNFLHLAQNHFYDHLVFHRVVSDFVVQGGDPTGTGWGGPGYLIPSEHSPLHFERGTIGMATAGFNTGGSQFFICLSPQPHLDGNYTAFGRVIDSIQTIDHLEIGDHIISIQRIK